MEGGDRETRDGRERNFPEHLYGRNLLKNTVRLQEDHAGELADLFRRWDQNPDGPLRNLNRVEWMRQRGHTLLKVCYFSGFIVENGAHSDAEVGGADAP